MNLKKEWTEQDMLLVEQAISGYFRKNFSRIDSELGLAYTSSGRFAALWICNKILRFDVGEKYILRGFALSESEKVCAFCEDNNENEIIVPIC